MDGEVGQIAYYLDDYADEVLPCEASLAGWAEWLSKPSEEWQREEPAHDGETFAARAMRFVDDIVATISPDGISYSRTPPEDTFLAIRFGQGLGWSLDNIAWGQGELDELLNDLSGQDALEPVEYIAVGIDQPGMRLVYRANPPRLEISGTVQ